MHGQDCSRDQRLLWNNVQWRFQHGNMKLLKQPRRKLGWNGPASETTSYPTPLTGFISTSRSELFDSTHRRRPDNTRAGWLGNFIFSFLTNLKYLYRVWADMFLALRKYLICLTFVYNNVLENTVVHKLQTFIIRVQRYIEGKLGFSCNQSCSRVETGLKTKDAPLFKIRLNYKKGLKGCLKM